MHLRNVTLAILALAAVAFCQTPSTLDGVFQIRYAANVQNGDSYVDIINTGWNGDPLLGPGVGSGFTPAGANLGNMCVNVYVMSSDEQLIGCCSCLLTPNQVRYLSVRNDFLGPQQTLTGATESALTIKLIGSKPGAADCKNSAATAGAADALASGYVAFGTTIHTATVAGTFATTETPFLPVQLSNGGAGTNTELASLTGRCASILGNSSGYGICASCHVGALGATKF